MGRGSLNFSLVDRVAIVTGGAQGIGLGIANALACAGCHVVIADTQTQIGKDAAREIRKTGREALFIKADVSIWADIEKMVDAAVSGLGKVDILVNNAGIMITKSIEETTEQDWDRTLNVNLKGVFLCSKAVGTHMRNRNRGKIINLSSVAATRPAHSMTSVNMQTALAFIFTIFNETMIYATTRKRKSYGRI